MRLPPGWVASTGRSHHALDLRRDEPGAQATLEAGAHFLRQRTVDLDIALYDLEDLRHRRTGIRHVRGQGLGVAIDIKGQALCTRLVQEPLVANRARLVRVDNAEAL